MATSTRYYEKYKANFKTAYLQKEIAILTQVDGDGNVTADDTITGVDFKVHVGDVVTFNGTKISLALAKSTVDADSVDPADAIKVGNYIVAQSDESMEYGHIPVEYRDYRYSDEVADSATAKKVALFKIMDVDDVNYVKTAFTATFTS